MKKIIFDSKDWEFPFIARVPDEMKENLWTYGGIRLQRGED